jgi:hypothetical protein
MGPAELADALKKRGDACLEQGTFARAEELLNQALAVVRSSAGESHPLAAAALRSLAEVAAARGK